MLELLNMTLQDILASKQSISSEPSQPQKALQINFVRPAQMSLFAKITCYPPLGEVTCVQRDQTASSIDEVDKVSLSYFTFLASNNDK